MRRAAAVLGAIVGAVAFAPVFCVTGHSDPGGSSTRCQALVHWLPPLRGDFAPGGGAGFVLFVLETLAVTVLFWWIAAPLDRRRRAR